MAFDTANLDGTVVAPGGIVPFGALKDAPSGTRVNTKMLGDMWQMLQQLAAGAGITLNNQPDNNTNGYQFTEALSKVIGNHAGQIVRMLIGGDYDPTKVYILWGCETRANGGYCYYDGEIYGIQGNAGFPCGSALVDIVTIFSPTLYTNGVQTLQIACGTSGSGIADFSDFIYVNKWKNVTGTVFTGVGGSITVDGGDITINKYLITGNTVQYQIIVTGATVSGTMATFQITLPFLTTNVKTTPTQICGVGSPDGALKCTFTPTYLSINKLDGTDFTNGTDNRNFDISVTFEID